MTKNTTNPYQVHHQVFGNYHKLSDVDAALFRVQKLNELRDLLKAGADVNTYNSRMETPLHRVFSPMLSLATAKLLIKSGAKVNATEMDGQTPLFWVVKHAGENLTKLEKQKIELLIDNGVDVTLKDHQNKTAVDYSEDEQILIVIKNLLSKRNKTEMEQIIPKAATSPTNQKSSLKL